MHARPRAKQVGLSLLELLIGLFIVSILAMVGLPTYSDYRVRTQIAEDFSTIQQVKVLVAEYYTLTGNLPTTNEEIGLGKGNTIKGVRLRRLRIITNPGPGTIRAVYDNRIITSLGTATRIDFVPTPINGGRLSWDCSYGDLPDRWRPASCRG